MNNKLLFPEQSQRRYYNLHNRRYIGSKGKLVDWIMNLINKETENCNSFADIFAGTGSIAESAVKYYNKVIINDFLYSNNVIYKAFFGNEEWRVKRINQFADRLNSIESKIIPDNYFSRNFGDKYFDYETSKKIGYIRNEIEKIKDMLKEKEYNILLASLLYSTDKIANTCGHYDAYLKKKITNKEFKLGLIKPINTSKTYIYRQDANKLAGNIKSDIVYIDPPYNSRQYSRFYHLLETLTKWTRPKLHGVALKPGAENMSKYCRNEAKNAFNELIHTLDARYIIVSYNNTYNSKSNSSRNKISFNDLKNILSKKGTTKIYECKYRFFNAGNTSFKDHKELLFITRVNNV